jgi:hypothetical protein
MLKGHHFIWLAVGAVVVYILWKNGTLNRITGQG